MNDNLIILGVSAVMGCQCVSYCMMDVFTQETLGEPLIVGIGVMATMMALLVIFGEIKEKKESGNE